MSESSPNPGTFSDIIINEKYVKTAVNKLKNGKAMGTDNIPGEFLKHGGNSLMQPLLDLFKMVKLPCVQLGKTLATIVELLKTIFH